MFTRLERGRASTDYNHHAVVTTSDEDFCVIQNRLLMPSFCGALEAVHRMAQVLIDELRIRAKERDP